MFPSTAPAWGRAASASAWHNNLKLFPHAFKRTIHFTDMTGNIQKMVSPGVVEFVLNGRRGQMFFVFTNRTANMGTYGGGRMLYGL